MIKKTQELLRTFSSFFPKIEPVCLIISVNALTICLDKPITNSVLWVQRRGSGKSFFLKVLAESNPKYFFKLPERFFETSILDFKSEVFQRRVWIHDDLVVAFHGLTTKQRQQLLGFFVEFLSQGRYSRKDRSGQREITGKISCIFPIASENYSRYGRELFYQTLVPERLVPVGIDFDIEDLEEIAMKILEGHDFDSDINIKLPFTEEDLKIIISEDYKRSVLTLSKKIQLLTGMSLTRATIYTCNWLKAHALLNNRNEISKEDTMIFENLIPFHGGARDTLEYKIRRYILKKLIENREVSTKEIYERFQEYNKRSVRRILERIRKECYCRKSGNTSVFYI